MGSKDDLQTALRSLRNVRRMARRLQRVPVDCLRVNDSDIADAEYVTEWLGIVLCRVCGQALRLEGKLKKQGVSIESIKGNPLPEYRRARIALGCIMK